ncbi:hypothetical protein [Vulcaniibacterium tengchongense]|uniref:hypothetical protein n=1 Tax=Vulcaniibacterium tengchongense TaxID=1273429 RepID=UPI001F54B733|nr:hypothetical protein [Vulcaniibacterium tengchongense]
MKTRLSLLSLRLSAALACGSCLFAPASSAADTTPFQCERLTIAKTRSWIAPILRDFCNNQEARNAQAVAKILGKPRPSTKVYLLPAYGSAEAKRTGLACVGGTAMRRLANGWEQLRDQQHNWVRCRDLSENSL